MTLRTWTIVLGFAFLLFGCNAFLEEIGGEGQPCSTKNTCRDNLVCDAGICVNPDSTDGDTPVDGDEDVVPDGDEPVDGDEDVVPDGDEPVDGDTEPSGGSWRDSSSGLVWQNPPADSLMDLEDAKDYCNGLDLDGHNDWYLPTISELRSLIRGCPSTVTGGTCGVMDDCLNSSCQDSDCYDCSSGEGPADGCYWPDEMEGPCSWYWSSSPVEDNGFFAWHVIFNYGSVTNSYVDYYGYYVRCVR